MAFKFIYRNLQWVSWDFILLLNHHVKPFPLRLCPHAKLSCQHCQVCGGLDGGEEVCSGHSMVGIEGGAPRSPSNDFLFFPWQFITIQ
jgi:hypothetical protein